ncbi:MAG: adenylate/guanylate cyclase domain-containing response regulator [Alphaproteobacteria bacterium 13_2_20CM_2_64_7]|nr:MAG: adenylate/guanylate cyclase domain-containing response regulator [Alphaproteobacteria bacterium 13_2_20CM_2_64_7]
MTVPDAALLVVDDNEDNRYTLTRRLKRLGYTNVATATNGREALEVLQANPIDLVLLDIMMPDMNGYEVLERLKADPQRRHIPVIMISAIEEVESVIRCIELGAEDYLSKPFNPTLLRARVGASLERKKLNDQVRAQAADLAAWNQTLEQRVADQLTEIERVGRLKRFLSPQIADLVVSSGDSERVLESHRRAVTVVFCDLRGFTSFAETAEPEEVMAVLGAYHDVLGPLIHRYEGTLERFAGDGLNVLFNDPLPCPDPSVRAVRMAVEMRAAVANLALKWRKLGHELGFGMGIAHGYATLGRIGFEGRYDYSAIGTVVTLAARLCNEARSGQILVDGKVHMVVEALTNTEPLGELALKGMQRPVSVFNILAMRDLRARAS